LGKKRDKREYADRREYLITAVKKRRRELRQLAIEYKGGKCEICGYDRCNEALEFHHLDNSKKEFGISEKGYTHSWAKVKKELGKCILVCANCHRELHAKIAAPNGNIRMKNQVNSGKPKFHIKMGYGNPEPSTDQRSEKVQRLSRNGSSSMKNRTKRLAPTFRSFIGIW